MLFSSGRALLEQRRSTQSAKNMAGVWGASLIPLDITGKSADHCIEMDMIRVVLPFHLRNLAQVGGELTLEVNAPVTQRSLLDALETRYPMLRGTIRDHVTKERRPFLRFFACEQDLTHEPPDTPLPDAVVSGTEPFIVLGAIAGG